MAAIAGIDVAESVPIKPLEMTVKEETNNVVLGGHPLVSDKSAFLLSVFGVLIGSAMFAPLVGNIVYILVYIVIVELIYWTILVFTGQPYLPWQRALVAVAVIVGFLLGWVLTYLSNLAYDVSHREVVPSSQLRNEFSMFKK